MTDFMIICLLIQGLFPSGQGATIGVNFIIIYLFQGLFPPGQGATIGVDFMIKTVEIDGEKVKVSS